MEGGRFESGPRSGREPLPEGHWLEGVLREGIIERVREYPANREWSTERIVLELLLGKLVEGGAELDPPTKARLRNLVKAFRALAFPNMKPQEQRFLAEFALTDVGRRMAQEEIEINPELKEDISWIWDRYDFNIPSGKATRPLLKLLEHQD